MPLLGVPAPYDFELSTERFRAFGADPVTAWHDGALHRVVAGREVRIAAAAGGVEVDPLDAAAERELRHLLGLAFDLDAFRSFAAGDPVLARVERLLRGFRPALVPSAWEMLVGSIAAQQVSLFAATAVRRRFVERLGTRVGRAWAFPAPGVVASSGPEPLLAAGFSRRKAETVLAVAAQAAAFEGLHAAADEEVRARIVLIRGLGEWTADWFLARHLGRPGAWPAGDLALRKAVVRFYGPVADFRAFGSRFEPFQNLAAHYLLLALRAP